MADEPRMSIYQPMTYQPHELEIYQTPAMDEQLMVHQSQLIAQQSLSGGLQSQLITQQYWPWEAAITADNSASFAWGAQSQSTKDYQSQESALQQEKLSPHLIAYQMPPMSSKLQLEKSQSVQPVKIHKDQGSCQLEDEKIQSQIAPQESQSLSYQYVVVPSQLVTDLLVQLITK
jgi:hypothetical protein